MLDSYGDLISCIRKDEVAYRFVVVLIIIIIIIIVIIMIIIIIINIFIIIGIINMRQPP